MGVTTNDIFGAGAQPAMPGTYGTAPSGFRLPDATRLGGVRLQVTDLARSLEFYENVLGLRAVAREASRAVLTAQGDDRPLVELEEHRVAAAPARVARLGLYHFAILLPDRPSLARFVKHLGDINARAGAGDHLVSEAFYLQDPDGLGIEVYADRPRDSWRRVGRELMMATDPVDVRALVQDAGSGPWRGMPAGTVMGHVHLHVGDLERAIAFYAEGLGFDRTVWSYPGALFLGAGGYHHHVGTNLWAGSGAKPAGEGEPRLLEWTIEVPTAADVAAAAASLTRGGFVAERDAASGEDAVVSRDPWDTTVRIRAVSTK
ncbi:MAG TPA: VOC family protein [Gemmatimonadaceae bacterium]|nr:VOC family protein [Gemmatimonadaceae bacterium]